MDNEIEIIYETPEGTIIRSFFTKEDLQQIVQGFVLLGLRKIAIKGIYREVENDT